MSHKSANKSSERVHIISRKDGWAVKKEGASRAIRIYENKDAAVKSGEKLREQGHDLIIHKKDGTIQDWKKSKD